MITGYYIQIAVQMDLKCRQERLVFVDPEDEEISYWWPAIVKRLLNNIILTN
jgi:hypothetical protein